ncbi:MAG TPA: hypothetical protein VEJ23_08855 [Solirubrobacteraceae bacterium]|nr:hypothetical protein [Solirubrobacteraceae bacterium]
MATDTPDTASTGDSDWRVEFELEAADRHRSLRELIRRVRTPSVVRDAETSVPEHVVVTHDGARLFAYAGDEATMRAARRAIEDVLVRDGIEASARVSRWDERRDDWLQVDPPPSAQEQLAEQAAERDEEAIETRTLVASSGKLVRGEFEQTMLTWAERLGVRCEIVEHPHLLTTQVAFTVTGPRRKVQEFSKGLLAEGWSQVRSEFTVMGDPL